MSRAFVREDAGPDLPDLAELPISPHPNWERPAFLAAQRARRDALAATVTRLRAEGGEDPLPLAMAERDLRWLAARLASAIEVPPAGGPDAGLGATVTVADDDGRETTYILVGEDEADPRAGRVSPFSPLGRALAGAHAGDVVGWHKPGGTQELDVLSVTWPEVAPLGA